MFVYEIPKIVVDDDVESILFSLIFIHGAKAEYNEEKCIIKFTGMRENGNDIGAYEQAVAAREDLLDLLPYCDVWTPIPEEQNNEIGDEYGM